MSPRKNIQSGKHSAKTNSDSVVGFNASDGRAYSPSHATALVPSSNRLAVADSNAPHRKPKRNYALLKLIIVILFALAIGIVAAIVYSIHATQTKCAEMLDESIDTIQTCDGIVVEVDKAIDEEVTADRIEFLEGLIDGIPATKERLNTSYQQATEVVEKISDDELKQVAEAAQEASDSRNEMLNYGRSLIQNDINAFNSATALYSCYECIYQADDYMRSSVNNSSSSIQDSLDYDNKAIDELNKASLYLSQAKGYYQSADFSTVQEYLEHKTNAAKYALATDEALQKSDVSDAKEQNELFEEEDAKAAEIASSLPTNVLTPILTAFDSNTAEVRTLYNEARKRATSADAVLRDYLGIEVFSDNDNEQEPEEESSEQA